MGVKQLFKFIEKHYPGAIKLTKITDYSGKILGIDTSLIIYKLIYAIRARGYDLKNNDIVVTHIYMLSRFLSGFKKYNIVPVFVFDGKPPNLKQNTLDKRDQSKLKMIQKHEQSTTNEGKRKYFYAKSVITDQEFDECRKLIELYGFPIIDAKEEADSQLVQLYNSGLVNGIVSDDMDILLFGGGLMLKNFTVNSKKKITEINLNEIKMSHDDLIKLGLLLGTDYSDIKPISIIKALKLLNQSPELTKSSAFNYFKNPPVHTIKTLPFVNEINRPKLIDFLISKNYTTEKIEKILSWKI